MSAKRFDPDLLLRKAEERAIGVGIPLPLSRRLDALVEAAEEKSGSRVYRKDLVAALVLAASEDPQALADLVATYRTAKVRDAGLADVPDANVLQLRPPAPGPRRRR